MQHKMLHLSNSRAIIFLKEEKKLMEKLSFGQYIIHLRNKKAMSQRKLAETAGLTNSTVSRIEADLVKPDPATLEKLAKVLEVDKTLMLTKFGYSEIPEEFIVIARKTGELSEKQREKVYKMFNETIDQFLLDEDEDEDD